jgi:beta-lactamase regulating signal transducer with metallopeptidase domain/HEAT repeat protein
MNSLIEILNGRGAQFLRFAWPMLWQSSLLIALLFALDFALRKRVRATVRYALWMLVLVKLVLPASLCLPTGVGYWVPAPQSLALEEAMAPPMLAHYENPRPAVPTTVTRPPISAAVVQRTVPLLPLTWPGIVAASWFCCVVVLTMIFLLRAAQARRIAARATATDDFSELLSSCARKMRVRPGVSLRLSDAVNTPAVCGVFRPVILLPRALAGKLDAPQMRAVLLHELAHIRRGDLWAGHLQTTLQIFYFYNPFLWLANAAIRRVREEAVDELVLVAMAEEAAVYPETLLNVAKFSLQAPRLAFGFAGILEGKSTLGARLRLMLQRPWPTSAKLGVPAAAALLLLAFVLLPMGYAGKMPSYQGKTAEEWLNQMNFGENLDDRVNVEGINAFKQMGNKAVPFLRKALVQTIQTNISATGKGPQIIPGSGIGRPRMRDGREYAAFILERMGPVAAPAIPELLGALPGHDTVAIRAAAALGAIGPQARSSVPALFTALRSGNEAAGEALVRIDPDNPALVPALIEVVQNPPPSFNSQPVEEAVQAAVALKDLGPRAKEAVPALRQMLAQTNGPAIPSEATFDARIFAALALQKIAPDQPALVAEINAALHPPPGPLPDINQLLDDAEKANPNGRGSESLGYALYKLGGAVGTLRFGGSPVPDAMIRERILPLFARALDGSDAHEFGDVFGGMIGLGRAAAPLLPRVIAFLGTNDSSARLNGICLLGNIAPGDMATLPILVQLLNDVDDPVRQNACSVLTHFGPEAKAAIPGLHRCLKENNIWIQFHAALALWHIAKEPPSIPLLKTAISLDENGDYVPLRTLEMLGGLSAQTAETKSMIRQLAEHSNAEVRTNALALLEKIGERKSAP